MIWQRLARVCRIKACMSTLVLVKEVWLLNSDDARLQTDFVFMLSTSPQKEEISYEGLLTA